MRFAQAVDLYCGDMHATGRWSSVLTEHAYRRVLDILSDDVSNGDPADATRDHVKRTLRRWHGTTLAHHRAILCAFFDWTMEEGIRETNPARQTPKVRSRAKPGYRLTDDEVHAMLAAADDPYERRAVHLGIYAGLRNAELRGLQAAHFDRAGWLWVSADIAKGSKERWVPVLPEVAGVADEIRANVGPGEYVLAPRYKRGGSGPHWQDLIAQTRTPISQSGLIRLVKRVAVRAGITASVYPHTMRHAFAERMARETGDVRVVSALLGHSDLATTQIYMGRLSLDQLAAATQSVRITGPFEVTGALTAT